MDNGDSFALVGARQGAEGRGWGCVWLEADRPGHVNKGMDIIWGRHIYTELHLGGVPEKIQRRGALSGVVKVKGVRVADCEGTSLVALVE